MNFSSIFLLVASYWRPVIVLTVGIGVAARFGGLLWAEKTRAERAQRTKERQVRDLAEKISNYGRQVHRRYPTGEVVIGEHDLAAQFRKRPDLVGTALNLLLGERKVQKAPLHGYWKLNV